MYVFDSSAFIHLHHSYYLDRFPTLWKKFNDLIKQNSITSTREVLRECENDRDERFREWLKTNKELFCKPSPQEAEWVKLIFHVKQFQQIIEKKKILKGGLNADPFIIVRAAVTNRKVVTLEKRKPNAIKISEHL